MKRLVSTKQFKKDLKLSKKRSKDLNKIFIVIELLIKDKKLPEKYQQHKLSGNYKKYLESHIEPDWLLIYKTSKDIVTLYRTGSHSDLF